MSLKTLMLALRTPLLLATAAVVAVAVPATAILGLPVALPSASQHIDTPAGYTDVSASEQGADLCYDLAPQLPAAPSLPAVPTLPVPLPVGVPSIPAVSTPSAGSSSCVHAGMDGAYADLGIDAAGHHIGTGVQADSPVDAAQAESTVDETADNAEGFFEGLLDTLFGWI